MNDDIDSTKTRITDLLQQLKSMELQLELRDERISTIETIMNQNRDKLQSNMISFQEKVLEKMLDLENLAKDA